MAGWHLAQLNIARLAAPLDHPSMAGFVQLLEPVNLQRPEQRPRVPHLQLGDSALREGQVTRESKLQGEAIG